jgi:OmcA/MtrC family decaheme c-type cytochrome
MHMANFDSSNRFLAMVAMALLISLLTACGGSSGDKARPDAPPPAPTEPPRVTITNATIAGVPVVDFTVVNRDGFAVTGITQASFTVAKLVPGRDGDSNAWQSYINRVEQPGTGDWPGTEPRIQATAESNGVLQDNRDGTYRYTFATDLTGVSTPLAVSYQPDLTHLIGVQLGGSATGANAIYSFQPSTGRTRSISDRRIVNQETCGSCHGTSLAAHGGSRVDAEYCVTCHNPGTADAQSGETVDFRVMVHKIHMGSDLPSGTPYVLWGFRDSRHDFSNVAHPQDVRNCLNCHDPDNAATPQASQILTHPSVAACGSCHDDVNFETGENHIRGVDLPVANDACTACHSTGGVAGNVLESHAMPAKLASEQFRLNVLDLELRGDQALVTFSVTNPEHGTVRTRCQAHSVRCREAELDREWFLGLQRPAGPQRANLLMAPLTDLADGSYRATAISVPQNVAPSNPGCSWWVSKAAPGSTGSPEARMVRITGSTRFFAPDMTAR